MSRIYEVDLTCCAEEALPGHLRRMQTRRFRCRPGEYGMDFDIVTGSLGFLDALALREAAARAGATLPAGFNADRLPAGARIRDLRSRRVIFEKQEVSCVSA